MAGNPAGKGLFYLMKKNLVAALATALTIGAASTTFAAANPFSDVPRDHWAYDAVTQLAADGVVEGYGDGTYRGDRSITRYEMAQMVAKAMAKENVPVSDRALIDRLAAEFADELNNLGVRVAKLEKNADMMKWTGFFRYQYTSDRHDGKARTNQNMAMFRVLPTAEVNKNWKVTARLTGSYLMDKDAGDGKGSENFKVDRAHAIGTFGKFEVRLGQMPLFSDVDNGMVSDPPTMSGATVRFGNVVRAKVAAGRVSKLGTSSDPAANVQVIELTGKSGKINAGVGYYHANSEKYRVAGYKNSGSTDEARIFSVGGTYTFDKNVSLSGAYAQNTEADHYKKADSVQLSYKGAKKSDVGSWGMFVAYRHLDSNAVFKPTYNAISAGQKGWEAGLHYVPFKNVVGKVEYFRGKDISTDKDASKIFARVDFNF